MPTPPYGIKNGSAMRLPCVCHTTVILACNNAARMVLQVVNHVSNNWIRRSGQYWILL